MSIKITTGTCADDGRDPLALAVETYPFNPKDALSFIEASFKLAGVIKHYLSYSADVAETVAEQALLKQERFARVSDGLFVLVQFEV